MTPGGSLVCPICDEQLAKRLRLADELRRVRAAGDAAAARPDVLNGRRALAAKIEANVAGILAAAPPPTDRDRERIVGVLQGVVR